MPVIVQKYNSCSGPEGPQNGYGIQVLSVHVEVGGGSSNDVGSGVQSRELHSDSGTPDASLVGWEPGTALVTVAESVASWASRLLSHE